MSSIPISDEYHKLKNAALFLKKELYIDNQSSNTRSLSPQSKNFCKNEFTNNLYSFEKGSLLEKELYRVMPIDGSEKIFFDSKDEYNNWLFSKNNRVKRKQYGCEVLSGIKA